MLLLRMPASFSAQKCCRCPKPCSSSFRGAAVYCLQLEARGAHCGNSHTVQSRNSGTPGAPGRLVGHIAPISPSDLLSNTRAPWGKLWPSGTIRHTCTFPFGQCRMCHVAAWTLWHFDCVPLGTDTRGHLEPREPL